MIRLYKDLNDYELIYLASENNDEANNLLFEKYKPIIINIANRLMKYVKNTGLELNDLIQEGMLGLNQAIINFNSEKNVTFYTFAVTCIERKILSSVIKANRQKNKILNESLSFAITDDLDQMKEYEKLLSDNSYNPEYIIENDEQESNLFELASKILTDFELSVFELKVNNFTYHEIADILEKTPKAIDNALQRIKSKLKKGLNEKNN